MAGGDKIVVADNTAYANLVGGIAIFATWWASITGNQCNSNTTFDIFTGRDSRYSTFTGNSCGPGSAQAFGTSPETLAAQTLHGIVYPGGDTLYGIKFCTVTGNSFNGKVALLLANECLVADNLCAGSASQGIVLQGSKRNTVRDNRVTSWAGGYSGIQLASMTSSDGVPVGMSPPITSENNSIVDNDVYDSTGTKTPITDGGTGNTIFGNRLEGSTTDKFYESGIWTPVLTGSGVAGTQTYAVQTGYYVRIGKLVVVQGVIILSGKDVATTLNMRITGLPYSSSATGGASNATVSEFVADLGGGYSSVGGNITAGASVINLTQTATISRWRTWTPSISSPRRASVFRWSTRYERFNVPDCP